MESKDTFNIFSFKIFSLHCWRGQQSYKKVVYTNFMVTNPRKPECLGHVQKRLGTRLRNLSNEKKHEILFDGKIFQEKED